MGNSAHALYIANNLADNQFKILLLFVAFGLVAAYQLGERIGGRMGALVRGLAVAVGLGLYLLGLGLPLIMEAYGA